MKLFLIVVIFSVGCTNKIEKTHTHALTYINSHNIINELKNNSETINLNFKEHLKNNKSNFKIYLVLDIDYRSKIKGNIDSSSYFRLVSLSEKLTIFPKDKNTFSFCINSGSNNIDSILYDVYLCSREKKYVDSDNNQDTVNKVFLFQRKEFIGK
jgi:hypothetical protein